MKPWFACMCVLHLPVVGCYGATETAASESKGGAPGAATRIRNGSLSDTVRVALAGIALPSSSLGERVIASLAPTETRHAFWRLEAAADAGITSQHLTYYDNGAEPTHTKVAFHLGEALGKLPAAVRSSAAALRVLTPVAADFVLFEQQLRLALSSQSVWRLNRLKFSIAMRTSLPYPADADQVNWIPSSSLWHDHADAGDHGGVDLTLSTIYYGQGTRFVERAEAERLGLSTRSYYELQEAIRSGGNYCEVMAPDIRASLNFDGSLEAARIAPSLISAGTTSVILPRDVHRATNVLDAYSAADRSRLLGLENQELCRALLGQRAHAPHPRLQTQVIAFLQPVN